MYYKFLIDKISKQTVDLEALFVDLYRGTTTVTFCNPLTFKILKGNERFHNALENVDYIFSDGILLCKFIKRSTGVDCQRYSFDGNSIAPSVFSMCNKYDLNVALVGTTDEFIQSAVGKLEKTIKIVYYRNGYLNEDDIRSLPGILAEKKVNVVIFGMGAPHQEYMLTVLKKNKFKGIAFTCGGYFEQIAKKEIEYYPPFFNTWNLRWLYRILMEPRKIMYRYVFDYWPFYRELLKTVKLYKDKDIPQYSNKPL